MKHGGTDRHQHGCSVLAEASAASFTPLLWLILPQSRKDMLFTLRSLARPLLTTLPCLKHSFIAEMKSSLDAQKHRQTDAAFKTHVLVCGVVTSVVCRCGNIHHTKVLTITPPALT